MARHSGRLFIGLALLAILAAAFIFFDLEKIAHYSDDQKNYHNAFNAAVMSEYRQIFGEIVRREENYRRAKESLYPDIFFVPAKSGVILETDLTSVPEEADGLTEPQN